jgi:hypothetical protein
MINLSRQQLIVLGIVILIAIILLSVGISVADRAPTQWKGNEQVVVSAGREPLTNAAPALAVYDNKLYLVYKELSGDTIWWSWYDGSQWKGHEQVVVPGRGPLTNAAPALAVYEDKLYLVYKAHSDNRIFWSWYDGSRWEGDEQVDVAGKGPLTNAAPALAVYEDKLYLAYKAYSDNRIFWSWYDGSSSQWKGDDQVKVDDRTGPLTDAAPALAVYDNKLYLVYKAHSDNRIFWSWYDGSGSQWKGLAQVVVPGSEPLTDAAPALAVYDNKLYLVYKGHSVDTIWWSWHVRR